MAELDAQRLRLLADWFDLRDRSDSLDNNEVQRDLRRIADEITQVFAPICDVCKEKLTEYGGLAFSPPDRNGLTKKYHFCRKCFDAMIQNTVGKKADKSTKEQ